MPKRISERYDVDRIRVIRGEITLWPKTNGIPLSEIIDQILPDGSVFHILNDVPDDTGLQLLVLVDGRNVVRFELPYVFERSLLGRRKNNYHVGMKACDVEVYTFDDYRRRIGQGKGRILLDNAAADALSITA